MSNFPKYPFVEAASGFSEVAEIARRAQLKAADAARNLAYRGEFNDPPQPSPPTQLERELTKQELLAEQAIVAARAEPLPVIPIAAGFIIGNAAKGDTVKRIMTGILGAIAAKVAMSTVAKSGSKNNYDFAAQEKKFKAGEELYNPSLTQLTEEWGDKSYRQLTEIGKRDAAASRNIARYNKEIEENNRIATDYARAIRRQKDELQVWEQQRNQAYEAQRAKEPQQQGRAKSQPQVDVVALQQRVQNRGGKSTITG